MAPETQDPVRRFSSGFLAELHALFPWWLHLALALLGALLVLWFVGPIGGTAPVGLLAGVGAVGGLLFLPVTLGLVHLLSQPSHD